VALAFAAEAAREPEGPATAIETGGSRTESAADGVLEPATAVLEPVDDVRLACSLTLGTHPAPRNAGKRLGGGWNVLRDVWVLRSSLLPACIGA
jgi:hypothetical protein